MRHVFALTLLTAGLLGLAATLSGCGTPAQSLGMNIASGDALQLRGFVPDALRGQVALGDVGGGESTKWYWGSKVSSMALAQSFEDSLRSVGLIPTMTGPARYLLNVDLVALVQPLASVDTTVTLTVNYTLVDRLSGTPIYKRTLRNAATVDISDKVMPEDRLRQANETAMRQNVLLLIHDLVELRPDPTAPVLMAAQPFGPAASGPPPKSMAPMGLIPPVTPAMPATAPVAAPQKAKATSKAKAKARSKAASQTPPAPLPIPASVAAPAPATPSAVR